MAKALILNDYTNDLIHSGGVLFTGKGAQDIQPAVCDYLRRFAENGDYIAVCIDTHDPADRLHPEASLFPPHNLRGTWGNELYGEAGALIRKLEEEYPAQITEIRKNRYSSFAGTRLDLWLRERGIREVTIGGVCTDMCVLHTAVDAFSRGFRITVPRAICFTPNEAGAEFVFAHLSGCMGVEVV